MIVRDSIAREPLDYADLASERARQLDEAERSPWRKAAVRAIDAAAEANRSLGTVLIRVDALRKRLGVRLFFLRRKVRG